MLAVLCLLYPADIHPDGVRRMKSLFLGAEMVEGEGVARGDKISDSDKHMNACMHARTRADREATEQGQ